MHGWSRGDRATLFFVLATQERIAAIEVLIENLKEECKGRKEEIEKLNGIIQEMKEKLIVVETEKKQEEKKDGGT